MDPEIKLSKLKPIDYDEIINTTQNFKVKSEQSSERMNVILKKSKLSKDKSKLIEHKKIWSLESLRLNKKKRKLQRKIATFINSKMSNNNCENFVLDLRECDDAICVDHCSFKSNIIDPVWALCEDIKEWKLKKSRGYKVPDAKPIEELISSMKSKLNDISMELKSEENCLMDALEIAIDHYSTNINSDNIHEKVGTGIPLEAWDVECYDQTLLTELLCQFLNLDTYFQTKLDQIEGECDFVDKKHSPNEWSEDEIDLYDHLQDVYFMHGTVNRNILFQDILKLVFQSHPKKDMMEIEKFVHAKRLLREKRQSLVADWKHDRSELFTKIKASIIDYNEQMINEEVEFQKIKTQKEICYKLTEQVNDWRAKKEQLRALENALNQEIEEKNKIELNEKTKKEMEKRDKTKKMIVKYKFEKHIQSEKQIEEKRRRIDELRDYLQKQAIVDEERVNYRENLRLDKLKLEKMKKEQFLEQQKVSEMKLNQLIEQVRPSVEWDPDRIFKPTSTWLNHTEDKLESSESISTDVKPNCRYAIPLNTYNDKELLSNPRLRVENALREAGLINSDYARNVLKFIPTNQVPRKDCNLSDLNFLKHE